MTREKVFDNLGRTMIHTSYNTPVIVEEPIKLLKERDQNNICDAFERLRSMFLFFPAECPQLDPTGSNPQNFLHAMLRAFFNYLNGKYQLE